MPVNRDLVGLKPDVLLDFRLFGTTVALIFLEVRGTGLTLVKLEGLMMGLLGKANLRFESKGDNFTVVISSAIVSVVDGISVVVTSVSVANVVGCVVKSSIIGLVLAFSVDVVNTVVVEDGLVDVIGKMVILIGCCTVD